MDVRNEVEPLDERMNSATRTLVFPFLILAAGCSSPDSTSDNHPLSAAPPNIIIILTDDQGYEDVGVYGATGFETPNLDRLAAEGMRFTSFYTAESACSPTRASILTGSYPLRAGIHDVLFPATLWGLNPDEITIAELARDRGYATAAVGKWHLGDHPLFLPTNHGFDSYFGIPYSNDMSPAPANNPWPDNRTRHPPLPLVRDTTVIEREPDQAQLTRRYTAESVEFIRENRDRPFFLYLAHTMPHAPLFASEAYDGTTERGTYGDVISEIDWSVGKIVETLEDLDLNENTFVFFCSDNGPWLIFGNHGGSAGPFREGKATTFEGGHRVPAIAWMPGRIAPGSVSAHITATMDLLPTVAGLIGASVPTDRVIDGKDLRPILDGRPEEADPYEAFFYYRGGRLEAVRSGKWKLHVPHWYVTPTRIGDDGDAGEYERVDMPLALFDLEVDPGETTDVQVDNQEVVERLLDHIERARTEIGDYLTGSFGTRARPPAYVETSWSQNPLAKPEDRVSMDPAVPE
ncbi:sulfatase [Bacteroidota bacterium]